MTYRGDNLEGPGHGAVSGPLGHIDEWVELAVDYIDGAATEADAVLVDDHIAACPSCFSRLQDQLEARSFLHDAALEAPPSGLEDRVLGELLFPSQVVALHQPQPPRSSGWQRRLRAWVPAATAVAAVLIGIIAYGVFLSDGSTMTADGTTTTLVASQAPMSANTEAALGATGGDSSADATAAAPSATSTAAGAATTSAGATVRVATETTVSDSPSVAAASVPSTIVDRGAMVATVRDAAGPMYIAFTPVSAEEGTADGAGGAGEGPQSGDGSTGNETAIRQGDSGAGEAPAGADPAEAPSWMEDVVLELAALTELQPLPADISLGQPVFAVYLDRRNVPAFIDVLKSIAASYELQVSVQNEPDGPALDSWTGITERKRELPLLVAHLQSPATARISFTTSTLAAAGAGGEQQFPLPDEAGTHVLTVLFMKP